MPFGGNDWLALTEEPSLEPEIPICDPHHHFWDLRPERIPYPRYLLHELLADISSGHNVRSTVFVETRAMYRPEGPEELRPVGEVEFVQGLAAASASGIYGPSRAAASIVGHANLLLGERVEPVLEALQAASPNRFRGIRQSVAWDPNPEVETGFRRVPWPVKPSGPVRGCWHGWAFSLEGSLVFPQMPELAEFAKAVPDLSIILIHLGGLSRTGPYANRGQRGAGYLAPRDCGHGGMPQCNPQVGGHGNARLGFDWHARSKPAGSEELAETMAPYMDYCIEQFGPDRVCSKATSRRIRCPTPTMLCITPSNGCLRAIRPASAPLCSMILPLGYTA